MDQFALDTAVTRVSEELYRGEVVEGWRVGDVPNGGYLMAIAGRALRDALPHNDPMSVNAFFLAPATLGPIDCRIQMLRTGRSTTFAEAGLYQDDELKVKLTAAYTDLERLSGDTWSALERPDYTPWEDCEPAGDKGVEFRQRAEIRLVSGREVFKDRSTSGSGVFEGWVAHRDGTPPDVISMLMFADSFPPPIFTVFGPVGWVPTVELTVQVRAHPAPGPLQSRVASQHITNGIVEEDGLFWDSAGELVMISRQTAKFRRPKKK